MLDDQLYEWLLFRELQVLKNGTTGSFITSFQLFSLIKDLSYNYVKEKQKQGLYPREPMAWTNEWNHARFFSSLDHEERELRLKYPKSMHAQ